MPYEMDYSLIGTTEISFEGDPSKARISEDEIVYLCAAVSRYFRKPLDPRDVAESFSGVRPLYDDGAKNASAAKRDYVLDLDAPEGSAPLLSVFGGKITTYRLLAEDAIEKLVPRLMPPDMRGQSQLTGIELLSQTLAGQLGGRRSWKGRARLSPADVR
jgi:glycerol-3-phosphate dehydrogenase